jgi:hypothetical protein
MKKQYRELSQAELQALQTFAARHGRKWKESLAFDYWMAGRVFSVAGKDYPELHGLRNQLGPQWLKAYRLNASAS